MNEKEAINPYQPPDIHTTDTNADNKIHLNEIEIPTFQNPNEFREWISDVNNLAILESLSPTEILKLSLSSGFITFDQFEGIAQEASLREIQAGKKNEVDKIYLDKILRLGLISQNTTPVIIQMSKGEFDIRNRTTGKREYITTPPIILVSEAHDVSHEGYYKPTITTESYDRFPMTTPYDIWLAKIREVPKEKLLERLQRMYKKLIDRVLTVLDL